MKIIGVLILAFFFLLAGCAENNERSPCKKIAESDVEDKEWLVAKCFEEMAMTTKDIIVCNYIGNEAISERGENRVYSRSTCRNFVYNSFAYSKRDPKYCELIDEKAKIYVEEPKDLELSSSEKLKSKCRDLLNN